MNLFCIFTGDGSLSLFKYNYFKLIKMKKSVVRFHWIPRILAIVAILFVSMFALDSFAADKNLKDQITAFLIHLIPSFILLILLIVAWQYELAGGILFLLTGLLSIPLIYSMNYGRTGSIWIPLTVVLMINIPFVITGLLFILSYRKERLKS